MNVVVFVSVSVAVRPSVAHVCASPPLSLPLPSPLLCMVSTPPSSFSPSATTTVRPSDRAKVMGNSETELAALPVAAAVAAVAVSAAAAAAAT